MLNSNNLPMSTVCNNQNQFYAIVGDNGFGVVVTEYRILEGLRNLKQATLTPFTELQQAHHYAYAAYCGRFFMRNAGRQEEPELPDQLPLDTIFVDPYFEKRELGQPAPFFPGLPL